MNSESLIAKFARLGVRLKLSKLMGKNPNHRPLTLDVRRDDDGEFYDIWTRRDADVDLDVVDLRRRERHLLLEAQVDRNQHYYLCGHDEFHWFVAAIPEAVGRLTNVVGAMDALKPREVIDALRRQGVKGDARQHRKNAAYVRQGEWFFLPMPKLHVVKRDVLCNEPLIRGAGNKPHYCEMLYRNGGETVYVCDAYPQGLRWPEYRELTRHKPRIKAWDWQVMRRNPEAYAKGKIRHIDHKTIELHCWHKILMNTENQAEAMKHVVFLD
jgi:hypothetical protein